MNKMEIVKIENIEDVSSEFEKHGFKLNNIEVYSGKSVMNLTKRYSDLYCTINNYCNNNGFYFNFREIKSDEDYSVIIKGNQIPHCCGAFMLFNINFELFSYSYELISPSKHAQILNIILSTVEYSLKSSGYSLLQLVHSKYNPDYDEYASTIYDGYHKLSQKSQKISIKKDEMLIAMEYHPDNTVVNTRTQNLITLYSKKL